METSIATLKDSDMSQNNDNSNFSLFIIAMMMAFLLGAITGVMVTVFLNKIPI